MWESIGVMADTRQNHINKKPQPWTVRFGVSVMTHGLGFFCPKKEGRMDMPYCKWYYRDWLADFGVRRASLAARGLWIDMISLMGSGERIGYLQMDGNAMTPADIAKYTSTAIEDVQPAIAELEKLSVFSRTDTGIIYCRRMVRDAELHRVRSEIGSIGGRASSSRFAQANAKAKKQKVCLSLDSRFQIPDSRVQNPEPSPISPPLVPDGTVSVSKTFVKPTPEEAQAYAKSIGYELDGQLFCDHYAAAGWRRGNTPIRDWKACVRTWKSRAASPSRTSADLAKKSVWAIKEQLKAVEEEMAKLEVLGSFQHENNQKSRPADFAKFQDLRTKRNTLKADLLNAVR